MSDIQGKSILADNTGENISIDGLFDSCRIQERQTFFKILLYFPFGLLLLLIRLIVGILALLILSLLPQDSYTRSFIFKWVCKILGVVVELDEKYLDDSAKLLIANHVSILDRIAVNCLVPCKTLTNEFHLRDISEFSFWKDTDVKYTEELPDDDILSLQSCIEDSTIHVLNFPEGATTNGKVGLLKFNPSVFTLNLSIQPVLIRISLLPFVNMPATILGKKYWTNILWLFFLPCSFFSLKVLPSMVKSPEESARDFSKRVQLVMATALDLIPTFYTAADKAELIKRNKKSHPSLSGSSGTSSIKQSSMAEQYSSFILKSKDLSTEEFLGSKVVPKLNIAAKNFGKSPKERMLSYQERKAMLVEFSRIKYLQKHAS